MLLMMALTLHFLAQCGWQKGAFMCLFGTEHCYSRMKAGRSLTPYVELHIAFFQFLIKEPLV